MLGSKVSPNTDGLNRNPDDVEITGCLFSVGDDCIAVKSGKISVGAKYKVPSSTSESASAVCRMGMVQLRWGVRWRQESKFAGKTVCVFHQTDQGASDQDKKRDVARML